jgi:undecaprenyl-diphosphatase
MSDNIVLALVLGIVEGLTEFLPISSTGHLIILSDILGFDSPSGNYFEVVIQLGSILAICWLYRSKLWQVTSTLHNNKQSRGFAYGIALAFLPSMIGGFLLHGYIKEHLFSPTVVAVMLIVGGIIMLGIEHTRKSGAYCSKYNDIYSLPLSVCLKIGMFQTLALIPGTSRSGATIIGAMLMGLDRRAAAEFSFFLAIPTMFAATFYDLYKNWASIDIHDVTIVLVGFFAAFLSSLLIVKALIAFISRHTFTPFAVYRIVFGALMLWVFWG